LAEIHGVFYGVEPDTEVQTEECRADLCGGNGELLVVCFCFKNPENATTALVPSILEEGELNIVDAVFEAPL